MAMNFWIWQQGHRQQKQKQTSGTAQQRNQSTKRKGSLWNGRKYLQSINLIRGWFPKYIGNSHNSTAKKSSNSIQKLAKDLTRWFAKEDIKMVNKHMQKCSTILFIRKMQIEITLMYLFTSVRITASTSVGKDADLYEVFRVIIMETKSKMILARN